MTLSPGTRLGQYEVADPIGAGGMGALSNRRGSIDKTRFHLEGGNHEIDP